jgi:signal peptide peptidase SppA
MDKTLNLINEPMLMEPSRLASLIESQRILRSSVKVKEPVYHISVSDKTIALAMGAGYTLVSGGVAIVPIIGPMFKGEASWGYTDQNEIRMHIRNAVHDQQVNAIMLLIDSPGGSVAGTMDLADEVRAAGKIKPTMAYAEDLMASAAMWVGAAANEVYANASALIGSIGVVTSVVDMSKALEGAGIKVHTITTGKFKAAGNPYTETSPDDLAYIQSRIDAVYTQFVESVSKGRGIKGDKIRAMEAAVFTAADAVENKLIDGIMSFDQAFTKLTKTARSSGGKARALAEMSLMEMEN